MWLFVHSRSLFTCTYVHHVHVYLSQARRDLRGKTLGCFCVPLSCHGHVLARVANSHNDEELLCQLVREECCMMACAMSRLYK